MSGPYDDILHARRPVSTDKPPLSMEARAAQFAPFAALTGFELVIAEAGRHTDRPPVLDEQHLEELNRRLQALVPHLEEEPEVELVYFRPDELKSGGQLVTLHAVIRQVDEVCGLIELCDRSVVELDRLTDLHCPALGI